MRRAIIATMLAIVLTAGVFAPGAADARDRHWGGGWGGHHNAWRGGWWRHGRWDRGFGGFGFFLGPDTFGFSFTGGVGYPRRWGGYGYGAGFAVPLRDPYYGPDYGPEPIRGYRSGGVAPNGGCRPVWTIDYERGRRAVLGATKCTDGNGGSYIVPESRHFIRWY